MSVLMSMTLAAVAVLMLAKPVWSRPSSGRSKGQAQALGQKSHNYYGKYNKCEYEVWPWPSSVECTTQAEGGHSLSLDPRHFRIALSPDSQAADSSVLLAAVARYQGLVFNQPTRKSRGKLVEPQFHFEEDDDHQSAPSSSGGGAAEVVFPLTALAVTVLEDAGDGVKGQDADESYSLDLDAEGGVARLTAVSVWGAIYGLDTFSQLVQAESGVEVAGFVLRGAPLRVQDAPRYPWRGKSYMGPCLTDWLPSSARHCCDL
jgi:hypothetical protein